MQNKFQSVYADIKFLFPIFVLQIFICSSEITQCYKNSPLVYSLQWHTFDKLNPRISQLGLDKMHADVSLLIYIVNLLGTKKKKSVHL